MGPHYIEKNCAGSVFDQQSRMILQIYIDQVFKQLDLPFYNKQKEETEFVIWMYNGASYLTPKFIPKFCHQICFLYMNNTLQSLHFHPIENLKRIIQIRINGCHHRACMIEEINFTISKKWERLIEEDYRKCMESMHKQCKLVI